MGIEQLLIIDPMQPPLMLPFKRNGEWLYWQDGQLQDDAYLDMYANEKDTTQCYIVSVIENQYRTY
jgi:hypothetical protein